MEQESLGGEREAAVSCIVLGIGLDDLAGPFWLYDSKKVVNKYAI